MTVVNHISELDLTKMKESGCTGVVFDWDLTLADGKGKLTESGKEILNKAVFLFGKRVAILSNTNGRPDSGSIATIKHSLPKPFCGASVRKFFEPNYEKLTMIGDRLLTDALLAKLSNLNMIYVRHKNLGEYPEYIKPVVWLEHAFLAIIC